MKKFHKIISLIFQPLLVPTFAMLLLMNMDIFLPLPLHWRLTAIIGTFLLTGILPAVPILLMIRRGEVKDLFISKREERTLPYIFSFIAYVCWVIFMWRMLHFPIFIVLMGLGSAISIFVIVIINLKWKISAHLAGMGGLWGAIIGVCYRTGINPVWLFALVLFISGLVAFSRLELKAHTPGQALAGFVVGFIMVFLPAIYF